MVVREQLLAGDRVVVQVFQGMGGVGKTQLAAEYACRFAGAYDLAWWVNAEQAGLIGDQFAALGVALGSLQAGATAELVRASVLGELRERGRWLLVFDSAERPPDIAEWLPGGGGHVLITSRERGWADIAITVDVDVLARAESAAVVQSRVTGLGDTDANRVADELGDLPLALAQAAGFMAETGMPAAQYLELLQTRAGQLLDHGAPGSYPRSLAAATQLTAERLAHEDPATAARRMCVRFWLLSRFPTSCSPVSPAGCLENWPRSSRSAGVAAGASAVAGDVCPGGPGGRVLRLQVLMPEMGRDGTPAGS